MDPRTFYDDIASVCHLVYDDWPASVRRRSFDAALSADNSVPHLLSDAEILEAFRAFYACTRSGGVVLITVRDHAGEDRSSPQLRP